METVLAVLKVPLAMMLDEATLLAVELMTDDAAVVELDTGAELALFELEIGAAELVLALEGGEMLLLVLGPIDIVDVSPAELVNVP